MVEEEDAAYVTELEDPALLAEIEEEKMKDIPRRIQEGEGRGKVSEGLRGQKGRDRKELELEHMSWEVL